MKRFKLKIQNDNLNPKRGYSSQKPENTIDKRGNCMKMGQTIRSQYKEKGNV